MSRYTASQCRGFVNGQIDNLGDAIRKLNKNYEDMDFENAQEKYEMQTHVTTLQSKLASMKSLLEQQSFWD
jgi:flagellar capping protein FliD